MSKLTTPLLSLEAHGTVGDAITYQGNSRLKIVRKKPILPYSLTLAQQYQRWLYEDYCYLWHQQSQAVKALFRSNGVRFHLTGYQYWMKYMLQNLPDIAGWWKLDDNAGARTIDSSRHLNHANVIGASPSVGVIDGCFSFDGINDYLEAPHSDAYTFKAGNDFTIAIAIRGNSTAFGVLSIFLNKRAPRGYQMRCASITSRFQVYCGTQTLVGTTNLMDDAFHRVIFIKGYEGNKLALFVDNVLDAVPAIYSGGNCADTAPLRIGSNAPGGWHFKGLTDNVVISNSVWDAHRRQLYQERSYPS